MSDETDDKVTSKFKVVSPSEIPDAEEEFIKSEELDLGEAGLEVSQLKFFRNLKMYINKMIGTQWLLLYRREEDGTPIFVPNDNLSIEDQVFLAELAKHVAFNMISMEGREDV